MRLTLRKDIAALRQDAIARINGMAGQVRGRFVTVIPAQDMVYLEKAAEARRYLAAYPSPAAQPDAIDPDPIDGFPFIAQEVGITAPTAFAVARLYAESAATFRRAGAAIEGVRLRALKRAETARSPGELDGIVAQCAEALADLPLPDTGRPGGSSGGGSGGGDDRPPRPGRP
jgi:hypothetical protein